jgi:hypothetical protein
MDSNQTGSDNNNSDEEVDEEDAVLPPEGYAFRMARNRTNYARRHDSMRMSERRDARQLIDNEYFNWFHHCHHH